MSGTAIWTNFAPPYACIFMDRVETEFLEKEHFKPWIWLRYIDYIFFVWTHVEDEFYKFLERLNSFHPNLKFTLECSREEINWCNTVKLNNNQFVTYLYCKPTDSHQHLHYNSCHPDYMKKSSVYSQGLRIKMLCSDATSLTNHLKDLRPWFCNRGYPESMVKKQLRRVENRNRDELLCTNNCVGKEVGVPLIVTSHPHFNGFNIIMRKNLKHLQVNQTVKSVFTPVLYIIYIILHSV